MHAHAILASSTIKRIALIPLALTFILSAPESGFAQKAETNERRVLFNGNVFELSPGKTDTVSVFDPVTNQKLIKIIKHHAYPLTMNGRKIYNWDELGVAPKPPYTDSSFAAYLFKGLEKELAQLPDGSYPIDLYNIVIDTNGKAVYCSHQPWTDYIVNGSTGTEAIEKEINNRIDQLLADLPPFKPGMVNNEDVIALTDNDIGTSTYQFVVRDHIASLKKW